MGTKTGGRSGSANPGGLPLQLRDSAGFSPDFPRYLPPLIQAGTGGWNAKGRSAADSIRATKIQAKGFINKNARGFTQKSQAKNPVKISKKLSKTAKKDFD
jgi:hypothetical protein